MRGVTDGTGQWKPLCISCISSLWVYLISVQLLESCIGGAVTYDVIEKIYMVADYTVSRERHGKETAVANLKILCLNLPGRGTVKLRLTTVRLTQFV